MNSADFYLFYLHLANQKAIKNYTFITLQKKNQNFTYQKSVGRVEHRFVKETFALLAFAGLQKTIAVAEWRNLFGHRGHLTPHAKFDDYSPLKSDFSLYYNHSHSVQKTCKLKALNRFKKLVNPLTLSSNTLVAPALAVALHDRMHYNPSFFKGKGSRGKPNIIILFPKICSFFADCGPTVLGPRSSFGERQRQSLSARTPPSPLTEVSRFRQTAGLKSKKKIAATALLPTAPGFTNKTGLGKAHSLAYKTKLRETAKASSKRCLNLFNQRILSQSFKNFIIHNLQNCEKQATHLQKADFLKSFLENHLSYQGQNKLPLTLNKATTNYFEPAHLTLDQNLHSQTFLTFARLFLSQNSSVSLAGCGEMLGKTEHYNEPFPAINGRSKSREDHQMNLVSWAPILDLRGFTPRFVATKEEQSLEKPSFNRSLQQSCKFWPQLKTYGQPGGLPKRIRSPKKDFVGTARVSYIKDSFDSTKKEILLASPTLIKFYTASWLLESIRTELSSRNANIKRVLNQTFLLTQQPPQPTHVSEQIFNLPKKQTEEFITPIKTTNNDRPGSLSMDSTTLIKEASVIPYLIKGLRITFSGRLGGKKGMAKTLTKTTGRVPLSTLREKVDFAKGVVQTKAGSLGVKVWICHN